MWQSGNVQAVHDVMAPDAHTINPIFGDKKASREEWEHMISDVFEVRDDDFLYVLQEEPDESLRPQRGTGTAEHLYAGNQQVLVGEFFGSWRAWDGVRALDYLLTRPEVDPRHVGITGNSGGGTMTAWLCAVRLRNTTRTAAHVLEMALTSAAIPVLAVWWRMVGAEGPAPR